MSILFLNKIAELDRRLKDLEARMAAFDQAVEINQDPNDVSRETLPFRRRPGRPRKIPA